jgi:hypothetical protein
VRDEDGGQALPAQRAHRLEQRVDLARGEVRRWLVEQQHPGLAVQRGQDLGALLQAHGKPLGLRVQRHVQPGALDQLADRGASRRPVEAAEPAAWFRAEDDVLQHGQLGYQRERLAYETHRPGHLDLAAVRRQFAGDDAHQGGLARAVLADDRVHRLGDHLQVDPGERLRTAEGLDDVAAPDGRIGH